MRFLSLLFLPLLFIPSFAISDEYKPNLIIKLKKSTGPVYFNVKENNPKFGIKKIDKILKKYKVETVQHLLDEKVFRIPKRKISQEKNLKVQKFHQRLKSDFQDYLFLVKFGNIENAQRAMMELADINSIEYVDIDTISKKNLEPNDECAVLPVTSTKCVGPGIEHQWYLPVIGMFDSWDSTEGAGIVVAIIDDGVSISVPDIQSNLTLAGYDFEDDDNDARIPQIRSHGTRVAAILSSATNNGIGLAGIAGKSTILPIKMDLSTAQIVQSIAFAVGQGADVINMSFSSDVFSSSIESQISIAANAGIVLVGSTGNDQQNFIGHPASSVNVIAVGASTFSTNGSDTRANFSDYGPGIDILAPGVDIPIPTEDQTGLVYGKILGDGTSWAAPMVAGTAALLLSLGPYLNPSDVKSLIVDSARDIGASGYDLETGHGVLKVDAAINLFESKYHYKPAELWFNDPTSNYSSWKRFVGNIDTDPLDEVIFINPATMQVGVFENQINNFAGRVDWLNENSSARQNWEFAIGDYDNNGSVDVASINTAASRIDVGLSSGNHPGSGNQFEGVTNLVIWTHPSETTSARTGWRVLSGDFDGDSKDDIALFDPGQGRADVALSRGCVAFNFSCSFKPMAAWIGNDSSRSSWQFLPGDFNGDGKSDIAAVNASLGRVDVAISNGCVGPNQTQCSFNAFVMWRNENDSSRSTWEFQVADLNQDGNDDILAANAPNGRVDLAISNGTNNFATFTHWHHDNSDWSNQSLRFGRVVPGGVPAGADGKNDIVRIHPAFSQIRVKEAK